jgi:hypothetical protein
MKKVFDEHVVASIDLSDAVEVLFYFDYYDDKVWANIRKFVKFKKYTGPTKQGVKFDPSKLSEVKGAFETAKNMATTMTDEEFLRFSKSPIRDIVVHACMFKGTLGVDIREWLHSEKFEGWTRVGVRFPVDSVPAVIDALDKMMHTEPAIEESASQKRMQVRDIRSIPESAKSDSDIEGVPESLRHLYRKEDKSGK